jgi:hypothetical protein
MQHNNNYIHTLWPQAVISLDNHYIMLLFLDSISNIYVMLYVTLILTLLEYDYATQ